MRFPFPLPTCVVVALFGLLPNGQAVDFNWTDATGDHNYLTAGNWTPAGPPSGGAGNFARFYTGAPGPANITADIPAIQDILFGNDGTAGLRTLNHSAGIAPLTAGWVRMGVDPDGAGAITGAGDGGTYNLSGTAVLNTGRLNIAEVAGSTATFTQAGTSLMNIGDEINVGQGGAGTFTISGGTANAGTRFWVGENGVSSVTQTGGAINFVTNPTGIGSFHLSQNAGGAGSTYTMSGGTLTQTTVANQDDQGNWNGIAENGGSNATFNLSGNALVSLDARTFLGRNGTATFNQTGGIFEVRRGEVNVADAGTSVYNLSAGTLRTLNAGSLMTIGQWDNGNGTVNVSGTGALEVAGRLVVAAGQDPVTTRGTLAQTGGTVTGARNITIGDSNLAVGVYTISGGMTQFATAPQVPINGDAGGENGNFVLGNRGEGTMTITGGTLRQADVVDGERNGNWNHIGQNNTSTGTFNLSGTGLASFDSRTLIASNTGSVGVVNQTGGTFEVRRHELVIADLGTGTFNISNGVLRTARNINVGNWNGGNGNFNISGTADVRVGQGMIIGQTENATFTSQGTVTMTGGRLELQTDMLLGNGNGSTTTSGTFSLNGGTLDMTGGNIGKGSGVAVFNFNNGRLEGLGNWNLGDLLQSDGVLAVGPTSGTGISTINGNYSLLLEGDIELSIIDTTAFDSLNVNGTVSVLGGLKIVQDTIRLPLDATFVVVQNDGADPINTRFTTLGEGSVFVTPNGNAFSVSYSGGDGNDIAVKVVPEPATGVLILGALAALGATRRRRSA